MKKSLFLFIALFSFLINFSQAQETFGVNFEMSDFKKERLHMLANISASIKSIKNESIKIGNQIWMTKNLDVTTFSNGDPIPEGNTPQSWYYADTHGTPLWCYVLPNHPEYGKLYNGWAVHDKRGLAPKGWHVASTSEWKTLFEYLGGIKVGVNKITNKTSWLYPLNSLTNSSGFSAFAFGQRQYGPADSDLRDFGERMDFYTSNLVEAGQGCNHGGFTIYQSQGQGNVESGDNECHSARAVRCVKDE